MNKVKVSVFGESRDRTMQIQLLTVRTLGLYHSEINMSFHNPAVKTDISKYTESHGGCNFYTVHYLIYSKKNIKKLSKKISYNLKKIEL